MTSVLARCEKCDQKFRPVPQERPTEDGGVYMYLSCPHCLTETPIANITAKGLRMREAIQRRREAGESKADRPFRRLLERYEKEVTRP